MVMFVCSRSHSEEMLRLLFLEGVPPACSRRRSSRTVARPIYANTAVTAHRWKVQGVLLQLQVIALITHLVKHRGEHGRYLVVVPASVLPHWVDEISRFCPELSVAAYRGPFEERTEVWERQVGPCCLKGRLRNRSAF